MITTGIILKKILVKHGRVVENNLTITIPHQPEVELYIDLCGCNWKDVYNVTKRIEAGYGV